MQLTEQQRAELERRGWRLEITCGEFGTWVKGQSIATLYADGFCTFGGNPKDALELTAIAGGYRLVPEAMVEALTIMADGCPTHPGYRAKRPATATYCERCRQVWEARQTISRLQQDGSPGQHGVGCSITLTDQERQIVCAALQAFAEHAEWQAGQERPDVQEWRVAAATARAVRARFQQNGGEGR